MSSVTFEAIAIATELLLMVIIVNWLREGVKICHQ